MKKYDILSEPLDSDLLRTFLAVARHSNVTRAAEAIHRTQSAVSVQIKRLENQLQTPLFERRARGVALTGAGERLLQSASRIVRDLDQTAAEFAKDPIGGVVRVGIPDDYGSGVLQGILRDFAARHPSVDVSVRCEFGTEFPEAVSRGELDLAVCAEQGAPRDADIFFSEDTVWACARDYPVPEDRPVPLALFDRTCWWRDVAIDAMQSSGRSYRIAFTSESVSGVKAAISAGLAIGVLSRSTIDPDMRVLGKQDSFPRLPDTGLSLMSHADTTNPAVTAMADAIKRAYTRIGRAT